MLHVWLLQIGQETMHAQTGVDLVTGLRSKVVTVFGRPKWDKIMGDIKEKHPGKRVGVFVCGPLARLRPAALPRILGIMALISARMLDSEQWRTACRTSLS